MSPDSNHPADPLYSPMPSVGGDGATADDGDALAKLLADDVDNDNDAIVDMDVDVCDHRMHQHEVLAQRTRSRIDGGAAAKLPPARMALTIDAVQFPPRGVVTAVEVERREAAMMLRMPTAAAPEPTKLPPPTSPESALATRPLKPGEEMSSAPAPAAGAVAGGAAPATKLSAAAASAAAATSSFAASKMPSRIYHSPPPYGIGNHPPPLHDSLYAHPSQPQFVQRKHPMHFLPHAHRPAARPSSHADTKPVIQDATRAHPPLTSYAMAKSLPPMAMDVLLQPKKATVLRTAVSKPPATKPSPATAPAYTWASKSTATVAVAASKAVASKSTALATTAAPVSISLKSPLPINPQPPNLNPKTTPSPATTPGKKIPGKTWAKTTSASTAETSNRQSLSSSKAMSPTLPNLPDDNNSLIDPKVVPAVHSIIHLLQTHGPLSYEQLKFNMAPQMVPVNSPNPSVPLLPPLRAGQAPVPLACVQRGRRRRDRLQKVLDILHELGVIHSVDKNKLKAAGGILSGGSASKGAQAMAAAPGMAAPGTKAGPSVKSEEASPGNKSTAGNFDDPNPIYCFGNGVPRMDVVLPSQILNEIRMAGEEVLRTQQRIEILRTALLMMAADKNDANAMEGGNAAVASKVEKAGPAPSKKKKDKRGRKKQPQGMTYQHAHNTLRRIYELHPEEVVCDPVYAAALRMFRVPNTGPRVINRHGMLVENTPEMERVIQAGLGLQVGGSGGGRLGTSKKRAPGSLCVEGEGGVTKKRKKGRPPKNTNSASAERLAGKLKGGVVVGEGAPAGCANASWV